MEGSSWETHLYTCWLVVWNIFYFSILGIIIPTDELIFFRGVGQPPTSLDLLKMMRYLFKGKCTFWGITGECMNSFWGFLKQIQVKNVCIYDKLEAGSYLTTARGNDPHQAAAAAVCFPPQPTVEVGSRALWATARRSKLSCSFIHVHPWRGFLHALRV